MADPGMCPHHAANRIFGDTYCKATNNQRVCQLQLSYYCDSYHCWGAAYRRLFLLLSFSSH